MRTSVAAMIVAAGLALSGCSAGQNEPSHGQGQPSPSSTATAATAAFQAAAGVCLALAYREQIDPTVMRTVDCDQPHYSEIVYLGQFTGAAAKLGTPPALDGSAAATVVQAQRTAYETCSKEADRYLGHPYAEPGVRLRVGLPDVHAWESGARWYACDLVEAPWYFSAGVAEPKRAGSRKTREIAALCVDQSDPHWPAIGCDTPHSGEFVGGFLAPASGHAPSSDAEYGALYDRCDQLAAAYMAVDVRRVQTLVGVSVWRTEGEELWPSGRRTLLCFLSASSGGQADNRLTTSARDWGKTHPS